MMLGQLEEGCMAQNLLRADRNQQLRDMKALGVGKGEMEGIMKEAEGGDILEEVSSVRSTGVVRRE
jgi:hypothetical protein